MGPSFGGAGIRTGCMYAMWGAFIGSFAYIFLVAFGGPVLADYKYKLVKRYPWLDQKDPEEMD
jgi:chromate transport protein ChrA